MAGKRNALARAITAVENETPEAPAVLAAIHEHLGRALVVGFTGPPGAGKSTLVNAYIGELRRRGQKVGVVAVDPSSPITGGAILGDRIRMTAHADDPEVFVRSLASRGHLGGLSRTAARVIDVFDAAGKDVVIVETVGTGQSEVEVANVADVKIVACPPGLGDDIQAIKAGILEIADILCVTKADLPLAERTARQLGAMVHSRPGGKVPPVIRVSAPSGLGIAELTDAIAAQSRGNRAAPLQRMARLVSDFARERVMRRIGALPPEKLEAIAAQVSRGTLGFDDAAQQLISEALKELSS